MSGWNPFEQRLFTALRQQNFNLVGNCVQEHYQRLSEPALCELLRMLVRARRMEQALLLFNFLHSVAATTPAIGTQLLSHIFFVKDYAGAGLFFEKLRSMNLVDEGTIDKMVKSLISAGFVQKAIDIVSIDDFSTSLSTFTFLLVCLVERDLSHDVGKVFQLMEKKNIEKDNKLFTSIIKAFGKMNCQDKAVEVFYSMKEQGVSPDIFTFNTVLDVMISTGADMKFVQNFANKIGQFELSPTIHTFHVLLKGYAKHGNFDRVSHIIMHEIPGHNLEATQTTHSIVLAKYAHYDLPTAITFFDTFANDNAFDSGGVVTFLNKLVQNRQVDKAEQSFRRLLGDGAEKQRLERCGQLDLDSCCSVVIKGLFAENKTERAEILFNHIRSIITDFQSSTTALIHGYTRLGMLDRAEKLWREMSGKSILTPISATVLVHALVQAGETKRAYELYAWIKTHEPKLLSVQLFNTMMDAYARNYREVNFKRVEEVFEELKLWKFQPSQSTYHILIKSYLNNHNVDSAENALYEMKQRHLKISSQTFYIIFKRLLVMSKFSKFALFTGLMEEWDIEPDEETKKLIAQQRLAKKNIAHQQSESVVRQDAYHLGTKTVLPQCSPLQTNPNIRKDYSDYSTRDCSDYSTKKLQ